MIFLGVGSQQKIKLKKDDSLCIMRYISQQKFICFFQRQIKEVCEGGLAVLLRKSRTLFFMALAIPVILFVRALRPLVVIRFGPLLSRRMGHFIANTDVYLCERNAGLHDRKNFDIFYHYLPISNYQVKKMLERTGKLRISPFTNFTHMLDRVNRLLPGGQIHTILTSDRDYYGLIAHTKPHFSFLAEEERSGQQALQKLGIPNGADFVCFYARDPAYLDTVYTNYNWRYHDFRNSNIHNYIPAVEELTRRGYFAVRMGAVVKEALKVGNPMIIDYATKARTEFLDIYLGAKCRFFICNGAGISAIPIAFRRPIVWVDFVQLECIHTGSSDDLLIFKKVWLRKERRLLKLREILDLGIGRLFKSEEFDELGVELVENTPEEITAVAMEMEERLKKRWQTSEEDEELQRRFWSLFKSSELNGKVLLRIGRDFLRQNQEILG